MRIAFLDNFREWKKIKRSGPCQIRTHARRTTFWPLMVVNLPRSKKMLTSTFSDNFREWKKKKWTLPDLNSRPRELVANTKTSRRGSPIRDGHSSDNLREWKKKKWPLPDLNSRPWEPEADAKTSRLWGLPVWTQSLYWNIWFCRA